MSARFFASLWLIGIVSLSLVTECRSQADEPSPQTDSPQHDDTSYEGSLEDLAGDYSWDEYGDDFSLGSDGACCLRLYYCIGAPTLYCGTAKVQDGRLEIKWRDNHSFKKVSSYVIVPWDKCRYLIEPDELVTFCQSCNESILDRSRHLQCLFLHRRGDDKASVRGLPNVPEPWKKLLLASPVQCDTLCCEEKEYALLNRGTNSGLWVGMKLFGYSTRTGRRAYAEVTAVYPEQCLVSTVYRDAPLDSDFTFSTSYWSKEVLAELKVARKRHFWSQVPKVLTPTRWASMLGFTAKAEETPPQ